MKPEYDCAMFKKGSVLLALLFAGFTVIAQNSPADSAIAKFKKIPAADTSINYDELFRDFDAFMDSILSPHSYFLASLSAGKGYFNFEQKGNYLLETSKELTYSPTLGYYHKGGLGFTASGSVVNDQTKLNFYQFALTPSFDYLNNKDIATGISYSRFFTKDSLSFYTSPLQNEVYGYFTYRKSWIKPSIAMSYGWGSRSAYTQREELIQSLRLRTRGFTYINTKESVSDLSVIASLRHDFYWLDVFTYNDHIRFTPQLSFTSGTQKFGFNQSSNTYATLIRNGSNILYNTEDIYLDDKIKFQPLSLTLYLRSEYSIGKFFIQPQLMLDYYFPSSGNNFSTLFSVNAGVMF